MLWIEADLALWWASLGKNVSLEALARADLGMDGGELGEGGMEVPDVDAVHVQVLVTGSLVMVGRTIKVLTGSDIAAIVEETNLSKLPQSYYY
nr:hypothetical protein BaRGS_001807 [Batillaria attramentaria]